MGKEIDKMDKYSLVNLIGEILVNLTRGIFGLTLFGAIFWRNFTKEGKNFRKEKERTKFKDLKNWSLTRKLLLLGVVTSIIGAVMLPIYFSLLGPWLLQIL